MYSSRMPCMLSRYASSPSGESDLFSTMNSSPAKRKTSSWPVRAFFRVSATGSALVGRSEEDKIRYEKGFREILPDMILTTAKM